MEYRAKIASAPSRTQNSQISTKIKNDLEKKTSAKKLFELCARHSSELFKRLAFLILFSFIFIMCGTLAKEWSCTMEKLVFSKGLSF